MRWIPLEEVMEKHINKPGFAEGCEQAQRELDEEIAIYGTIGNPKSPQSPLPPFGKGGKAALMRKAPKRKPRAFSTKLKRTRATA